MIRSCCSTWVRSRSSGAIGAKALRFLEAEPGRIGADRFDRPQAICPDRAGAPDDGRLPRGAASLCEGAGGRSRRTPSCGFARRSCTGSGANRPKPSSAGG